MPCYHEKPDAIEVEHGVVVEVSDEAGATFVYAYTDEGKRLCFEFYSMSPDLDDVAEVARSIAALRRVSNKRPIVGRLSEAY